MSPRKKESVNGKLIADNRKARHNYEFLDTLEAGLVLTGTEVKSLRNGKANIAESYATEEDGEIWLINSYIPEYLEGNRNNHNPRRRRKLLLHKKQMSKLIGGVQREGMTIVPNRLYFNDRGIAKLQIALAKGRQAHDKRQVVKQRDWQREKSRLLREKG
ncbi:MAG: SsrA-binding protein SmpB [Rhizobiaceae bacterium]|jgi:SsrA-binding protein|nr:SsrA-binding protein SmpB [Rhizobiaceae bacterium]